MSTNESTQNPSHDNTILARDPDGNEHRLRITAICDMVAMEDVDGDLQLIMHPAAAIDLALQLILATKGNYRGVVGPLSGAY